MGNAEWEIGNRKLEKLDKVRELGYTYLRLVTA